MSGSKAEDWVRQIWSQSQRSASDRQLYVRVMSSESSCRLHSQSLATCADETICAALKYQTLERSISESLLTMLGYPVFSV